MMKQRLLWVVPRSAASSPNLLSKSSKRGTDTLRKGDLKMSQILNKKIPHVMTSWAYAQYVHELIMHAGRLIDQLKFEML